MAKHSPPGSRSPIEPESSFHKRLLAFEKAVPRRLLALVGVAALASVLLLAFMRSGSLLPEVFASVTAIIVIVLLIAVGRRHLVSRQEASRQKRGVPAASPEISVELAVIRRACRTAFAGAALFSGVTNVLALAGSLYMLEIYDRVLPSRSIPTLVGLTILVAILYGGQGLIEFIRGRVLERLGAAVTEALGSRLHSSVLRLARNTGHVSDGLQPIRDLDNVRTFLSGSGPTALFDLPWLPLYLIVIFAFHVLLGTVALVGAILLVVLTILAERLTRNPVRSASRAANSRDSLANGAYRNAEAIAAMGMGARMTERWDEANANLVSEQRKVSDIAGSFGAVSKVLRLMLQSAVLGVGAWLVIEQEATAGVIIAASILSSRALAPVDLVIANWKGFAAARQGWQRLNKILVALPADINRILLPAPTRHMTAQSVGVAAPGTRQPLVEDVTFAMEAGHGLAIIGPSGSGKSTLVRALVGAWQLAAGRVRLDGADLDQWAPEERGRHIGYLPQDVELFAGTVAENISRFDRDAEPALIIEAAKTAGAHELIVAFRDGYETQIGEQGETLSAGQRQRIALARALYGDPFLVVLDEPNSNLDGEGEQALNHAVMSVRNRGGIVLLVAHRPSVLGTVDFVLAMDQGRVHAFGPKDKVLATLFPRPQPVVASQGPRLRLATDEASAGAGDIAANSK